MVLEKARRMRVSTINLGLRPQVRVCVNEHLCPELKTFVRQATAKNQKVTGSSDGWETVKYSHARRTRPLLKFSCLMTCAKWLKIEGTVRGTRTKLVTNPKGFVDPSDFKGIVSACILAFFRLNTRSIKNKTDALDVFIISTCVTFSAILFTESRSKTKPTPSTCF